MAEKITHEHWRGNHENPQENHHWIKSAIKHPGALHRELHVPEGEKIPAKKMAAARSGKYGEMAEKRAKFAGELKGFHKG